MVQETSLEAYRQIQPCLGQKQAEVYRLLKRATECGYDMTNMEIARALRWSINRVTPRVLELREMGLVVLSQKRSCAVTGRTAMAWQTKR
jgi:DNA-binding MarR family transcriptional regulator